MWQGGTECGRVGRNEDGDEWDMGMGMGWEMGWYGMRWERGGGETGQGHRMGVGACDGMKRNGNGAGWGREWGMG
jgi:hypothetical protein